MIPPTIPPTYTVTSITPLSPTSVEVVINVTSLDSGGTMRLYYGGSTQAAYYDYPYSFTGPGVSLGSNTMTVTGLTPGTPSTLYYCMVGCGPGSSVNAKPETTFTTPSAAATGNMLMMFM